MSDIIAGLKALKRKRYQEAVALLSHVETESSSIAKEDLIGAQVGLIAAYEGVGESERARALRQELEAKSGIRPDRWSLEMMFSCLEDTDREEENTSSLPPSPAVLEERPPAADAPVQPPGYLAPLAAADTNSGLSRPQDLPSGSSGSQLAALKEFWRERAGLAIAEKVRAITGLKRPKQWPVLLPVAVIFATISIYFYTFSRLRDTPQDAAIATGPGQDAAIEAVAALGRLEPQGEIIQLTAPQSLDGSRVEKLLVAEGDRLDKGSVVAILDNHSERLAAFEQAEADVSVAEARLAIVRAGNRQGDINAQRERIVRLEAELNGQVAVQEAAIGNLEAQFAGERAAQEAAISRLQAELKNAEIDCGRYQNLLAEGAVPTADRDSFCLRQTTVSESLREAEANLTRIVTSFRERLTEANANLERTQKTLQIQKDESTATLESLAEVREVDLQLARAELLAARAAAKQAKERLDLTQVRAPVAGTILEVHTRPGEIIGSQGIVELGQTDRMYVVAEIYETDIAKIQPGQEVKISGEAFVDELSGKVEKTGLQVNPQESFDINPLSSTDNKVIEVRIRLDDRSSQKVANLSNLQVRVVIAI